MSLGIESSFCEKAKLKLTGKVTCAIRTPAVDRSVSLAFWRHACWLCRQISRSALSTHKHYRW